MKKISRFKYNDQEKLNRLTNIVLENIDDVYNFFDIQYYKGERLYSSECFIHGGDNKTALNLYHDADYRVHYKCRTHGCESVFGTSLLSMVRGGLSHIKYNWSKPGDKQISFDQTVDFLLKRYGLKFESIKGQEINFGNTQFTKIVNTINKPEYKGTISKDFYRSKIKIPSQYFLQRGYSKEILDSYDIGDCTTPGKPFYERAVLPVYDESGEKILGFSARSFFDKCEKCGHYHNPDKNCYYCPKWRHNKGFQKEKTLYNFWKAKTHIQKSFVAVITESPGNVWRLEEAGIHNSLALFGTVLNFTQKQLLDESGALVVVLIMDNDDNGAGQQAAMKIKEMLEKSYRVVIINITKNDIGEMSIEEINQEIKPIIQQQERVYK